MDELIKNLNEVLAKSKDGFTCYWVGQALAKLSAAAPQVHANGVSDDTPGLQAIFNSAAPQVVADERAAFEAKYGPKNAFAWRNADDTYKVASLQMAWEIWQARAALSTASVQAQEPFGAYIERDDGTTEFQRAGKAFQGTAHGYKAWTLYTAQAQPVAVPDGDLQTALADPDQVPYLIVFDDADRENEQVIGGTRARYRFKQISVSWNAHLFVKIASNSRDDKYPCAVLAAPAAQGDAKDAERWRWLAGNAMNGTIGIRDGWVDFEYIDGATEQVDAAIAAIAAKAAS